MDQSLLTHLFMPLRPVRLFLTVIFLTALLFLTACAGAATGPESGTIPGTTAPIVTTSATTTANGSSASPLPAAFSEADLTVTLSGQSFVLLDDAAELLALLGADYQYSEAESCVYDGMDKTFDYGWIILYTIPSGERDLIDGIDLQDDRLATARGIKVGDTLAELTASYGDQAGSDIDYLYTVSGTADDLAEPRLTFIMDGDTIAIISYYSGSNAQG